MCRSIVTLRGLEPPATSEELEAAARQYVRKVTGVRTPSPALQEVFEAAVRAVSDATANVLAELPPRRQPPTTVPPSRRLAQGAARAATDGATTAQSGTAPSIQSRSAHSRTAPAARVG